MMVQQEQPEDFVIATGKQYSVRLFVELAAREMGFGLRWTGDGVDEKGFDKDGRRIVAVDPRYFRPAEVETLLGDASKAGAKLGWEPQSSFESLVKEMVQVDLSAATRDDLVSTHGDKINDFHE